MNYIGTSELKNIINKKMGVSVIIPFYNGIDFLPFAVASVQKQTFENWELLIGINGYDDYTGILQKVNNIIKNYNESYKKKIHIKVYETKGAPATLNALAKDAKYDYVAFLDADDMWEPTKLEKQIYYLRDYDVVGTHCRYIGNMNFCPSIPLNDVSNHDIFKINPMIHSSILIKKELVQFEDHFVYDYNLWFKLFHQKKKFFNFPEVLVLHRVHNQSAFNNNNQNYLEELKAKWRKIYNES